MSNAGAKRHRERKYYTLYARVTAYQDEALGRLQASMEVHNPHAVVPLSAAIRLALSVGLEELARRGELLDADQLPLAREKLGLGD